MTYRTGNHGVTIVREGDRTPEGHITGAAALVAVVVNGDQALAERIAWLLTHTCPTCMGPQRETVNMVCQTCGTDYTTETPANGYKRAIGTLADVALRTGSPAARWAAEYLDADPDKRAQFVADSCTCTKAGPDPACPVHHGRRARGPKPPPVGPGCICDGSGRTCPRHGAVL